MVDLGPHQLDAIRRMKNGSVLQGGVGTGKTRTALAYFFTVVCEGELKINGVGDTGAMAHPTDLYVVTTAKKRDDKDWEKEAADFGISHDPFHSHGNINFEVISWNDLTKYDHIAGACFVFDEQRVVGSGAWSKSFIKLARNNDWILLTATPGDSWVEYIPLFVAHGFYKNRTEFLREHVVFKAYSKWPQIDHYVNTRRLDELKHKIVIDMPYERHTKRHMLNIIVNHDKTLFDKVVNKRWHIYEERPLKDVGEMFTVMRKLVNTDVSRMAAVMELSEDNPRLIIFYNFDYELEMLRQLTDILQIETAEWNGHRHQAVPTGKRWLYFVQYQAGAEGWNCTTTNAMVFWSQTYSYKLWEQSQGRIDRLNTPYTDLYYFVLRSDSMIDNAIRKTLLGKKDFNERKFIQETYGKAA